MYTNKLPTHFPEPHCNGKCSNCGGCCIPWLPLTYKEIDTIKDYISKHNIKPIPLQEGNDYYFDCCFHDRKNKRCTIYPVRPEVCKNFICSASNSKIKRDRYYYDRRADVNGVHLDRFTTMDLLFHDDPSCFLHFLVHEFKPKDIKELKELCIRFGQAELADAICDEEGGD